MKEEIKKRIEELEKEKDDMYVPRWVKEESEKSLELLEAFYKAMWPYN